jgi:hypothetical protein
VLDVRLTLQDTPDTLRLENESQSRRGEKAENEDVSFQQRIAADYLHSDPEVNAAVGGVAGVEQLFLGSSHSDHFLVTGADGHEFVAKQIYDFALAGCDCPATYEFNALRLASARRLAPRPLYVDRELNLVIMERVAHVPYDHLSLAALRTRLRLGMKLASLEPSPNEFPLLHRDFQVDMARNIALILEGRTVAPSMNAEGLDLERLADRALRLCLPAQSALAALPPVFSHNDLVSGNVLTTADGSVVAIDFETAGLSGLDFVIGQIAVDADIDWMLYDRAKERLDDLMSWLVEVSRVALPSGLLAARVAERLLQNVAYAFRQIALRHSSAAEPEYLAKKRKVLAHCCDRLDAMLSDEAYWSL